MMQACLPAPHIQCGLRERALGQPAFFKKIKKVIYILYLLFIYVIILIVKHK